MIADLIRKFSKDNVVFRDGDAPGELFIVHSGRVRILKTYPQRIETVAMLERGDFFGEVSVFEGLPRNATAIVADDNTELIVLDGPQLEKLLKDHVEVALRMLKSYCNRFRRNEERIDRIVTERQALDTGIQDILSSVRRKGEGDEDVSNISGWLIDLETNQRLALRRPEMVVGRKDPVNKQTPDLDLTPFDPQRTVSRRHARFSMIDDVLHIFEEPGVANGTLVNGTQVAKNRVVPLNHNDKIRFGALNFRLHLDLTRPPE